MVALTTKGPVASVVLGSAVCAIVMSSGSASVTPQATTPLTIICARSKSFVEIANASEGVWICVKYCPRSSKKNAAGKPAPWKAAWSELPASNEPVVAAQPVT